jgi:hypothetical protein
MTPSMVVQAVTVQRFLAPLQVLATPVQETLIVTPSLH